jgi:hypothetical protein
VGETPSDGVILGQDEASTWSSLVLAGVGTCPDFPDKDEVGRSSRPRPTVKFQQNRQVGALQLKNLRSFQVGLIKIM